MIAWAVTVSNVHEPLTLWSVDKTNINILLLPFYQYKTVAQLYELLEAVTECLLPYCTWLEVFGIV